MEIIETVALTGVTKFKVPHGGFFWGHVTARGAGRVTVGPVELPSVYEESLALITAGPGMTIQAHNRRGSGKRSRTTLCIAGTLFEVTRRLPLPGGRIDVRRNRPKRS